MIKSIGGGGGGEIFFFLGKTILKVLLHNLPFLPNILFQCFSGLRAVRSIRSRMRATLRYV